MDNRFAVIYSHIVDYLFKEHGIALGYNEDEDSYETLSIPWNLAERIIEGLRDSLKDVDAVKGVSMYTKTPVSGSMNEMIIGFSFNISAYSEAENHTYQVWKTTIVSSPNQDGSDVGRTSLTTLTTYKECRKVLLYAFAKLIQYCDGRITDSYQSNGYAFIEAREGDNTVLYKIEITNMGKGRDRSEANEKMV